MDTLVCATSWEHLVEPLLDAELMDLIQRDSSYVLFNPPVIFFIVLFQAASSRHPMV